MKIMMMIRKVMMMTASAVMMTMTLASKPGSETDKLSYPVECIKTGGGAITGVEWHQWYLLINVYLTCMVCLLGFVGNSLTVLVICRDKDKYNTTNWLLQTLAAADSLYLITCLYTQPITILHKMWNREHRQNTMEVQHPSTKHFLSASASTHLERVMSLPPQLLSKPSKSSSSPSPLSSLLLISSLSSLAPTFLPSSSSSPSSLSLPTISSSSSSSSSSSVLSSSIASREYELLTSGAVPHLKQPSWSKGSTDEWSYFGDFITGRSRRDHSAIFAGRSSSLPLSSPSFVSISLQTSSIASITSLSSSSPSPSSLSSSLSSPLFDDNQYDFFGYGDLTFLPDPRDYLEGYTYEDIISPCLTDASLQIPAESRKDLWTDVFMWPLASTAHTATIWAVVLLTSDRYLAICHPFKSHLRTLRRIRWATFGLFCAAVVYNIPLIFERKLIWRQVVMETETRYALDGSDKSTFLKNPVYQLLYKTSAYFIFKSIGPLVTLFTFNLLLLKKLRANRRRRGRMCHNNNQQNHHQQRNTSQQLQLKALNYQQSSQSNHEQQKNTNNNIQQHTNNNKHQSHIESSSKHRENITIMLIIVVSVFIVCQLPDVFLRIAATQFTAQFHHVIREYFLLSNSIANLLLTLNSSINFFIYCLVGRKFRNILINTLPISCRGCVQTCRRCRGGRVDGMLDDMTTRPETHRERMSKITLSVR